MNQKTMKYKAEIEGANDTVIFDAAKMVIDDMSVHWYNHIGRLVGSVPIKRILSVNVVD